MFERTAFVDERLLAAEFCTGDVVRKTGLRDLVLTPYVGRVVYSNTETGKVQVQWPWGSEQESPVELVKMGTEDWVPPEAADQTYSSWEQARHTDGKAVAKDDAKWRKGLASRVVAAYEERTLPLYRAACESWHCGIPEIEAFTRMATVFGEEFGSDAVRITVSNLYGLGRRIAIYWKNNKRKYRVTQKEKDSKKFACPRCKGLLRPRVYRQGRRILLCKDCGFSISPSDLR